MGLKYSRKNNLPDSEHYAIQAYERSKSYDALNVYGRIEALIAMAKVCREKAKYKSSIQHLEKALKLSRQVGDIFSEIETLNDLGVDYDYYVHLKDNARKALETTLSIRERIGSSKYVALGNLGWIFAEQGKWIQAKKCFQQAIVEANERSQSLYKFNLGIVYMYQESYKEAEQIFIARLEILEKYHDFSRRLPTYAKIALNYGLAGNFIQARKFRELSENILQQETRPRFKWCSWYELAELCRLLKEYETAKLYCQQSVDLYLSHSEDPENLFYLAEARHNMGKILVDIGDYQQAISYLNRVQIAFKKCKHYALGETWLYLGKAHQGLGGAESLNQAKEYIVKAIAEFQRLDLSRKDQEARMVLSSLL